MHRLLIVDDEPIIVNGLHEYFKKRNMPDIEILTAYSAKEAIAWLDNVKVDVVLSDIMMPEMNGMELLSQIERRWPKCKVIFLTGYNDFDYAHHALRSPCIEDYILKTEEMELIGESVKRALQKAKDEISVFNQKDWLQNQLPKLIHQLQRQLFLDVIHHTESERFRNLQEEFDTLRLPFRADRPVLPVLLAVEEWGKFQSDFERNLMLYAIGNIGEEMLGAKSVVRCFQYDRNIVVALLQHTGHDRQSDSKSYERLESFVHGTAESVQQACSDLFGLSLSVAATAEFVRFERLFQIVHRLRLEILNGRNKGVERFSVVASDAQAPDEQAGYSSRLTAMYLLEQLQTSVLEQGELAWGEIYKRFKQLFPEDGPADPFDRKMIVDELSRRSLTCLEELGLKDRAVSETNLSEILLFGSKSAWQEVIIYYQSLLEWIEQMKDSEINLEESRLIGRIHYFIQSNLDGDLSLTRIAREVSLNPSYLSRWYKMTCGKGLSDYIQEIRVEKGKELLQTTDCKVHEISEKLGFTDPHYFFRFFKKAVGCTPHEFRAGMKR